MAISLEKLNKKELLLLADKVGLAKKSPLPLENKSTTEIIIKLLETGIDFNKYSSIEDTQKKPEVEVEEKVIDKEGNAPEKASVKVSETVVEKEVLEKPIEKKVVTKAVSVTMKKDYTPKLNNVDIATLPNAFKVTCNLKRNGIVYRKGDILQETEISPQIVHLLEIGVLEKPTKED